MAKYLANENVPAEAIVAARQAGFDIAWVQESSPGADDEAVLSKQIDWEGHVAVARDRDSSPPSSFAPNGWDAREQS
jgi:hypothetical protein